MNPCPALTPPSARSVNKNEGGRAKLQPATEGEMLRKCSYAVFMLVAIGLGWLALADGDSFRPFNRKPQLSVDIELPLAPRLS